MIIILLLVLKFISNCSFYLSKPISLLVNTQDISMNSSSINNNTLALSKYISINIFNIDNHFLKEVMINNDKFFIFNTIIGKIFPPIFQLSIYCFTKGILFKSKHSSYCLLMSSLFIIEYCHIKFIFITKTMTEIIIIAVFLKSYVFFLGKKIYKIVVLFYTETISKDHNSFRGQGLQKCIEEHRNKSLILKQINNHFCYIGVIIFDSFAIISIIIFLSSFSMTKNNITFDDKIIIQTKYLLKLSIFMFLISRSYSLGKLLFQLALYPIEKEFFPSQTLNSELKKYYLLHGSLHHKLSCSFHDKFDFYPKETDDERIGLLFTTVGD